MIHVKKKQFKENVSSHKMFLLSFLAKHFQCVISTEIINTYCR